MVTIRTPTGTWIAKQGKLYMDAPASNVTFDNSATLSGSFASVGYDISKAVKSITVTPPETSHEKVDLVGENTGTFQNQLLDEKPVGMGTLQATLILGNDETIEDIISGTFASAPAGYARYQYGSDNTSGGTVAAVVTMITTSTANEASFAFDNGKFTKVGDTRLSDAAGHWEQDFTIVCLPKDFYREIKD